MALLLRHQAFRGESKLGRVTSLSGNVHELKNLTEIYKRDMIKEVPRNHGEG
jgi:hypothetical protein